VSRDNGHRKTGVGNAIGQGIWIGSRSFEQSTYFDEWPIRKTFLSAFQTEITCAPLSHDALCFDVLITGVLKIPINVIVIHFGLKGMSSAGRLRIALHIVVIRRRTHDLPCTIPACMHAAIPGIIVTKAPLRIDGVRAVTFPLGVPSLVGHLKVKGAVAACVKYFLAVGFDILCFIESPYCPVYNHSLNGARCGILNGRCPGMCGCCKSNKKHKNDCADYD
jgi:hypothetical protein